MLNRRWLCAAAAVIVASASWAPHAQSPALAEKFEKQVLAYEADDRASPPPANAILFAGDSQFFRWKTIREDLAGYTLINRGIDSREDIWVEDRVHPNHAGYLIRVRLTLPLLGPTDQKAP